ncbi:MULTISPECIES: helix-turn-helix domain-containing protein [unclassified Enterococcus]|uniref:helix-turn-helix domain-containing protein n=1 Tax=unclassified Enterococcus TaxID=2608891 RepID=UPI0020CC68A2|nr:MULTISPECIES: helix-turn-helix domain-containing protein [unclassified Enterococcus]
MNHYRCEPFYKTDDHDQAADRLTKNSLCLKRQTINFKRGEISMNQVLILTRNILGEQDIQKKLQALNYEVFCSARVFENCSQQLQDIDFFNYFQYVILSETICEFEVTNLITLLKNQAIHVIRKVEENVTEKDHEYLEDALLHAIISNGDSVDELRECLYNLTHPLEVNECPDTEKKLIQLSDRVSIIRPNLMQNMANTSEENYQFLEALHHLSQTESRILSILLQAGGEIVTRETICHKIWNEEVNRSHLASLSSTVTRIKGKFEHTNLKNKAIHTLWGKGYRINSELLDRIQKNEAFSNVVSG